MDLTTMSDDQLQDLKASIAAELKSRKQTPVELPEGHSIHKLMSGALFYVGPFHPYIKNQLKEQFHATWKNATINGQQQEGWSFDPLHKPAFLVLLNAIYNEQVEQVISIRQENYKVGHAPSIDGWELARFSRDSVKAVEPFTKPGFTLVSIIINKLQSGGSARYPTCYGEITVRVRCRLNPSVTWGNNCHVTIEEV